MACPSVQAACVLTFVVVFRILRCLRNTAYLGDQTITDTLRESSMVIGQSLSCPLEYSYKSPATWTKKEERGEGIVAAIRLVSNGSDARMLR